MTTPVAVVTGADFGRAARTTPEQAAQIIPLRARLLPESSPSLLRALGQRAP